VRTASGVIVLVLSLLTAGGCGLADLDTFATRPDAVEARQILELVVQGDTTAIRDRLDPSQRDRVGDADLRAVTAVFSKAPPTDVHLVGYQTSTVNTVGGPTTETSRVSFESRCGDSWVVSDFLLRKVDQSGRTLLGLHAQVFPQSIEQLGTFSLRGKGAFHYLFLAMMLAVAAIIVAALIAWFRQRRVLARRWWWLLGILVGPFEIGLNWSSGEIGVTALQIHLFCLSAAREGLGPWILSFSIPAGAIVFLIQTRRGWPDARQVPEAPPASQPGNETDRPEK